MNKDRNFKIGKNICSFRSVGVFVKNGKVLVQRDDNEYALPGGHVKIGETSEKTLIREFKEETGLNITCNRMIWIDECIWSYNGKQVNEIAFYYLVDTCEDISFDEFISQKDNCGIALEWVNVDVVENLNIYPEFIKKKITKISNEIEHFVSGD